MTLRVPGAAAIEALLVDVSTGGPPGSPARAVWMPATSLDVTLPGADGPIPANVLRCTDDFVIVLVRRSATLGSAGAAGSGDHRRIVQGTRRARGLISARAG